LEQPWFPVLSWARCWEPGGERLDIDHYLEVLQRKPHALMRSLPLRQAQESGKWPVPYTQMFTLLKARLGESKAARHMVDVLLLHRTHPTPVVHQAVADALEVGAVDSGAVAVLVRKAMEGGRQLVLLDVGALSAYDRPQPQIHAYDQLLTGEVSA
jgi:hypothetical protein